MRTLPPILYTRDWQPLGRDGLPILEQATARHPSRGQRWLTTCALLLLAGLLGFALSSWLW